MTFFYILILGVVQGIAEFLPISSSGHLVLLNNIFKIDIDFMFLSILLHVATLLSVVVCFRKEIKEVILHPTCKLSRNIIVSFLPTVLIVLIFKGFFENFFNGGNYLSITFILTAILLMLCQFCSSKSKKNQNSTLSTKASIIMGIVQGIAVIPGISRSGSTITAGTLCGESKESTAKFSFLMSIPVIFASLLYDLIFHFNEIAFSSELILPVALSFVLSFLFGIVAIKFLLKTVGSKHYYLFSIYLVIIAIINLFL